MAVVSMEEVSVVVFTVAALVLVVSTVALMVALWPPDTLEAESGAAAVESALAEHTLQVAFPILPAQDPGSLHLVIHHPDNLCMMDDLLDPLLLTSRPIVARRLQSPVHRKHFRNVE
jgi:hypothetical protein